jgi:hypothetical protein
MLRERLAHCCRVAVGGVNQLEAMLIAVEPNARARKNVRLLDALIQMQDGLIALRAACSGALLVLDDDSNTLPS